MGRDAKTPGELKPEAGRTPVWECVRVPVRERLEADRARCVEMAGAVHDLDRYPMYLPDDLGAFLFSPGALGAWVAELDGEIAGHVALHPRSSPPVMALAAAATGLGEDGLCVVARLLVSVRHRRRGVGRALLEEAGLEARARGLRPVLDVVSGHEGAIALYEGCGWVRAGHVAVRWGDHPEVQELVYLGPVATPAP